VFCSVEQLVAACTECCGMCVVGVVGDERVFHVTRCSLLHLTRLLWQPHGEAYAAACHVWLCIARQQQQGPGNKTGGGSPQQPPVNVGGTFASVLHTALFIPISVSTPMQNDCLACAAYLQHTDANLCVCVCVCVCLCASECAWLADRCWCRGDRHTRQQPGAPQVTVTPGGWFSCSLARTPHKAGSARTMSVSHALIITRALRRPDGVTIQHACSSQFMCWLTALPFRCWHWTWFLPMAHAGCSQMRLILFL
jgi:hypothetical protein